MNIFVIISATYCFVGSYLENEGYFVINGLLYLLIYWVLMSFFPRYFIYLSLIAMSLHLYHLMALKHIIDAPDIYLDFIHLHPQILFYDKSLLNWNNYDLTFVYPLVVGLLCSITFAFCLVQR